MSNFAQSLILTDVVYRERTTRLAETENQCPVRSCAVTITVTMT